MKPYPFMTHPAGLAMRSLARRLGIVKLIAPLLRSDTYEEAFSKALLSCIEKGDCVWDVGANVGHYTEQFSSMVGDKGKVVAFEPSPRSLAKLNSKFMGRSTNVVLMGCALGSSNESLPFELSDDESGVTDQIGAVRPGSNAGASPIHVDVRRGDDIVKQRPDLAPNIVKIDVEGFELNVLQGLRDTLSAKALRSVFVEVHFGTLERRGLDSAPREIEALLRQHGLKVSWLDHSHLVARRTQTPAME